MREPSIFLVESAVHICMEGEHINPCSQYNSSLLELFSVMLEKDRNLSWSRKKMDYNSIKNDFDRKIYPEKCRNITYILLAILDKVLSNTVTLEFTAAILPRLVNEYDFPASAKKPMLMNIQRGLASL